LIDAQIGHEKTLTAILPALSGSNIIYGMGMLEMGMTMSYEQLLIDAEIVRMIRRIMQGIAVDSSTLALDVITAVGPGGTYLGQRHTMQHMRKESSQTKLIDRSMYEGWVKSGEKDMAERAHEEALQIIRNHKPEPLPEDVSKEIRSIIEEAEYEIGIRNQNR
jgi:trimethylamine---corrinoid protein Co-methyltransferase